jgi:hypothetical protein
MNKEKVIEILGDLQSYIEDEWDAKEYAQDIKDNVEALEIAINALQTGNIVGNLTIGNKKYVVSKVK